MYLIIASDYTDHQKVALDIELENLRDLFA